MPKKSLRKQIESVTPSRVKVGISGRTGRPYGSVEWSRSRKRRR